MKKGIVLLIIVTTISGTAVADMGPAIPDSFWAFGPSVGYNWSDNLSGWTFGFEALKTFAVFSFAAGSRFIFSDDDKSDFSGNNGLLSFYLEGTITLPLPIGIGFNYNFLLNGGNGPGLQFYYGVPIPVGKKFYISLFWRPSWIWIDGNAETMHEVGIYFKRSNYYLKQQEAARRRYEWRMRYLKKRNRNRTNNRTDSGS